MSTQEITLSLAVVATTLSVTSFMAQAWRTWRDRPRLQFYVMRVTFTALPEIGDLEMLRIMICNVGYRPIVLTGWHALGEKSTFAMGINDEPAAIYGKENQRFPILLEPGSCTKIHPISIASLKKNYEKPNDKKVFFDPFRYFVILDSFKRLYPIDVSEVRFQVGLETTRKRQNKLERFCNSVSRWLFLHRARRRWLHDRL